ncbi:efflux RND transporter permease subunit [Clostridium sp. BL-8]|uniref:efflux RND transporter permease subunit n=1 Tax=Clostridium sp. BL-8 TaxID=349938 RepID=UPI00098CA273|nr:efflux RND transporter permease subunit [Clostridium sp. BL-8]OOM78250.1 multidrug resistance protein MdtC [Clostridium sp. BL-8]
MKVANVSIKRPVFITVIMLVMAIVGMTCYERLVVNDMPEAENATVSVSITETGASPEDMETNITKSVEDAVGEISGVSHITSNITEGSSRTMIQFDLDKDPEVAAQEVRDKVSSLRGLPSDIDTPIISKFDSSASSILSVAVYGLDDNKQLSDVVDTIEKKLYTVSGIGAVNISGEDTREIHIKLDNNKLLQYGLTTTDVTNAIKKDNVDQSTGKISDKDNEISLKISSKITKVDDFKNILIANRNGTEIRVKDIADVEDGVADRSSYAYYDGKPAIGIDIVKQSGSNTVQLADDVKKTLNKLKSTLPKGVHVDVVSDDSISIQSTIDSVLETMRDGCILAVIIVFLFLNEWESTLISAISLPISIITTFICMKVQAFSLNTMTLMALSVAVGLLIDDAIVVIENIVRHLHMGKSPREAARDATSEIGFAVIATTSAVISVFLPVSMVTGTIGRYFFQFGLTVVFSMAVSLLVSFTLVPMMSSKMLRIKKKKKENILGKFFKGFNKKFDSLAHGYSKLLVISLHNRLIIIVIAIAMFVASTTLISALGFTMMPSTDNNQVTVSTSFDSGITLDNASEKVKQIEAIINKNPEVQGLYTTVSKSSSTVKIELVDKNSRKENSRTFAGNLSRQLQGIPGTQVSVAAASMASGGRTSKDATFELIGENREEVQAFGEKVKEELAKESGVREISTNDKSGLPEIELTVDRDKAADLGVSSSDVASTLKTLFNGTTVTKYDDGKNMDDVVLYLQNDQRSSLDSLKQIYVSGTSNKMIPLSEVTKQVFSTASAQLTRYDRQAELQISCNISGAASGTFMNSFMKKIQTQMDKPEDISVSLGGTAGSMTSSLGSLEQAMAMAALFLYLVMAAQFESFVDPISILFALPLAIIGAVLGLFICKTQLSLMSIIGIIMLMGLVAKNGILLIDAAKQKIEEGMEREEAIKHAGLIRLRPIVMTTLAMIFGMIPLAVSNGMGSEMRAPMAEAVIGGLVTSTILTLFVVPIMYTVFNDVQNMFNKKIHNKKFSEDEESRDENLSL